MTESKGWGLFAKEDIPIGRFICEYKGEVINNVELDKRFSQAVVNNDFNYYFLKLANNLFIDAKMYGNEFRYMNAAIPNAAPQKWIIYSDGKGQNRIGFFALKHIRKVFI